MGSVEKRGAKRWRDFEEAREFARSLGLGGYKEWRVWVKSGERPRDIPANPDQAQAYKDAWQGYGDTNGLPHAPRSPTCYCSVCDIRERPRVGRGREPRPYTQMGAY